MDRLGEELAEYEGDIGVRNGRATENSVPLMCNSKLLVRQRPLFGQLVIASLVYLAAFCCGLTGGFSGVLLPQLQANSSDLSTDDEMGSWIVSVYTGATSVGCLISGVIMNVAGRRLTVQIAVICMSVGWVLISLAHSHTLMLIGRALDGFGRGLSVPAFTFHLEETSDPRLRGTLSACILLAYSIGIMAVSMLGTALDWRIVAGLGVVISLLDLIGYSFLPESPVWLARNSRVNQAQEVYNWLWGNAHHKQAQGELQELLERLSQEIKEHRREEKKSFALAWKEYFKPHFIKSFFIIHMFNVFQIICGTNLFIFYAANIISGLNEHGNLDVNMTVVLTSVVRVIFLIVSCLLLVWFGRRPISISSGIGSGTAAMGIAFASYIHISSGWLMISLLTIFVAFNTYGYFVLPPSMVGELLPSKIRCFAGAYIFTMNDVALFAATKAFPSLVESVGISGLFWIFGLSSLTLALFLYLLLPETKGRSLVEVELYFLQSNILWFKRNRKCKEKVTVI